MPKKKPTFTYVAYAPNWTARKIQEDINDDKMEREQQKAETPRAYKGIKHHANFILAFNKNKSKDRTGEQYYNIVLYKQIDGNFLTRGEDDLKEILKFIKSKNRLKSVNFQVLDFDKINDALEKTLKHKNK